MEKYNREKHHRRSIRLKGYDYAQAGAYFITVCTHGKENLFGEITNGEMQFNQYGEIVMQEWFQTEVLRLNVELDAFVVMPNHVHGIILITEKLYQNNNIINDRRGTASCAPRESCALEQGTARCAPTDETGFRTKMIAGSLPVIVRSYKAACTKRINQIRDSEGCKVWQRGYYDHIIRDEDDLSNIREYISNNPFGWVKDEYNPTLKRESP